LVLDLSKDSFSVVYSRALRNDLLRVDNNGSAPRSAVPRERDPDDWLVEDNNDEDTDYAWTRLGEKR